MPSKKKAAPKRSGKKSVAERVTPCPFCDGTSFRPAADGRPVSKCVGCGLFSAETE